MKINMAKWIAWKLPKWLVYWCCLRVAAHATTGKWNTTDVPTLSLMVALERWKQSNKK